MKTIFALALLTITSIAHSKECTYFSHDEVFQNESSERAETVTHAMNEKGYTRVFQEDKAEYTLKYSAFRTYNGELRGQGGDKRRAHAQAFFLDNSNKNTLINAQLSSNGLLLKKKSSQLLGKILETIPYCNEL